MSLDPEDELEFLRAVLLALLLVLLAGVAKACFPPL